MNTNTPSTNATSSPAIPCPPELDRAIHLIGDRWTLLIAYHLGSGPKRFGELQERLGNVSPKTVSQRLKLLESIGFLERQAFLEIPPRVVYQLTDKGRALLGILDAAAHLGTYYLEDAEEPITPPDRAAHSDPG
jgi:DNA-binding HxlR family transcriptional regulator